MLLALKAARDAINPRPGTPGHFIFIGTGSHRAQVGELTARRNQAFAGATSVPYPVLNGDYVEHLLARLPDEGVMKLPPREVAIDAFKTLGNRPEELLKALRQLHLHLPATGDPNEHLPVMPPRCPQGHGMYAVTDSFVQETWKEQAKLLRGFDDLFA